MHVKELPTPLVLVDINKLKRNIDRASKMAKENNKELWPMVKTHKSTYIASLQKRSGSNGFLCGTIDEAEVLSNKGLAKELMVAYPVADRENMARIVNLLGEGIRVIVRIDNVEHARFMDKELRRHNLKLDYAVKVDVGMGRLGVKQERVVSFVKSLQGYKSLKFAGIVTHPGQAYSETGLKGVESVAKKSAEIMKNVSKELSKNGFEPEIVGIGSTPTFRFDVFEDVYTHLFPGNYVYYDRFQVEYMGSASLEDCSLTVLAMVISIPEHSDGKLAIINVGSKYLGLDRAAHGGEGIKNYGLIIEHPKARIYALSEEVGRVDISEDPTVKIGEKVTIIPNHACVVGNSTSYLIAHAEGIVKGIIEVDMRNGTRVPISMINTFLKAK